MVDTTLNTELYPSKEPQKGHYEVPEQPPIEYEDPSQDPNVSEGDRDLYRLFGARFVQQRREIELPSVLELGEANVLGVEGKHLVLLNRHIGVLYDFLTMKSMTDRYGADSHARKRAREQLQQTDPQQRARYALLEERNQLRAQNLMTVRVSAGVCSTILAVRHPDMAAAVRDLFVHPKFPNFTSTEYPSLPDEAKIQQIRAVEDSVQGALECVMVPLPGQTKKLFVT